MVLRYEGKSLDETADATGFHHTHISSLIRKYFGEGLPTITERHYAGPRRNKNIEEAALGEQYRQPPGKRRKCAADVKVSGIRMLTPHSCRHTYVSQL